MALTVVGTLLLLATQIIASFQPAPISLVPREVDPEDLYPAYNLSVPVDHFHNDSRYEPHSDAKFNLRYYFDNTYYKPGGPVIILQGGETSVTGRLPYLQKGIVAQLSQATGGIGVIIEHRYYGTSFPTADLSTENFRFLTTDQALADQAYFAKNIVFPGMEDANLTAPGTAWITYGGSYAGAYVAFLRVLYPELYWGAISSSGVTEAIWDYWQYYEPIRNYAPQDCVDAQTKLIHIMDNILTSGDNSSIESLKSAFNSSGFTYNDDFANMVSSGIGGWQSRNWDPAVNDLSFKYYCGNITDSSVLWPDTEPLSSNVTSLINSAGYSNESSSLTNPMLNLIGWTIDSFVNTCDTPLDECWGKNNASLSTYTDKSLSNYGSLSWPYQYCTEWGFLQSGSTVPASAGLPLVSRLVTLEYNSLICKYAFNITTPPEVERVNKYGGFNISYPRLAIVGGEADPWRPSTPLADPRSLTLPPGAPDRLNDTSTASEPVILIADAVHHWEENGLFPNETTSDLPPGPVRDAQAELAAAVQEWMAEWKQNCINSPGSCAHAA